MKRPLALIALFCLSAVAIALYSQHVLGMRPCAWCVFQRLLAVLAAGIALAGLVLSMPRPALGRLALALAGLTGLGGMAAAWHQYTVAAQQFSCAQTLADRWMTGLGLDAALPWLFGIQAGCMEARVNLLGVEYALWSLALFTLVTACAALGLLRRRRAVMN
ncbi:MAG: disulfide bond formation protein B [Castellaniella sp.]